MMPPMPASRVTPNETSTSSGRWARLRNSSITWAAAAVTGARASRRVFCALVSPSLAPTCLVPSGLAAVTATVVPSSRVNAMTSGMAGFLRRPLRVSGY